MRSSPTYSHSLDRGEPGELHQNFSQKEIRNGKNEKTVR
jgi:hypothetical protein